MTTAIILHKVADYEAWRPVYDSIDDERKAAGVSHDEVLRSQDDPQLVIVRHDFGDRAAADEFLQSETLRRKMAEAGVDASSLQVHFTEAA